MFQKLFEPVFNMLVRGSLVILACTISNLSFSQALSPVRHITDPLIKIGEQFPDFEFTLSNHERRTARMSDFRGKVVVLDLLTIGCSSCIAMLPELDSVRNLSKGEAEIISVAPDDSLLLVSIIRRRLGMSRMHYPFVFSDKLFHPLFRFEQFPAFIWIDKEGIVRAITRHDYFNLENIRHLASGKPVAWDVAVNEKEYDLNFPLMMNASFPGKNPYYSVLTGEMKNFDKRGGLFEDSGRCRRISGINANLEGLYPFALSGSGLIDYAAPRFFEYTKRSRSSYDYAHEYNAENVFCYEATFPLSCTTEEMFRLMLKDLNRFFNLNGRIEKRKIRCVVIRDIGKSVAQAVSIYDSVTNGMISIQEAASKYAHSARVSVSQNKERISGRQDSYLMPVYIESLRGASEKISVRLASKKHMPMLKEDLKRNGLSLIEEERILNVFVLSDAK